MFLCVWQKCGAISNVRRYYSRHAAAALKMYCRSTKLGIKPSAFFAAVVRAFIQANFDERPSSLT